jgi:hypothetical protein
MKTYNHTISFPSAVGELVVQYNFTPAEPILTIPHCGEAEPAEVEITRIWFDLAMGHGFSSMQCDLFEYGEVKRYSLNHLKQAVYEALMKQLKEKEDAEAERMDGYEDVVCKDQSNCVYPFCHCPEKEQQNWYYTSALHEQARKMWHLGQELLGLKKKEESEPKPEYPYSAEQPNTVRQNGLYIQMPQGELIPDHILQAGNHLEQPPLQNYI